MVSEMYPDPSVEDLGTYGADNVSIIYGLEFKTSQYAAQAEHLPDPPYVENVSPLQATTRSGRQIRMPWKVRDQLPEAPGLSVEEPLVSEPATSEGPTMPQEPRGRRVRLLVTERIKTAADRFGLYRLFKRRPVQEPDLTIDLTTVYTPTAAQRTAARPQRAIKDIIAPFPNLSSFLFTRHYALNGNKKSIEDRKKLQQVLTSPLFDSADLNVDLEKIDKQLSMTNVDASWVCTGDGWKHSCRDSVATSLY